LPFTQVVSATLFDDDDVALDFCGEDVEFFADALLERAEEFLSRGFSGAQKMNSERRDKRENPKEDHDHSSRSPHRDKARRSISHPVSNCASKHSPCSIANQCQDCKCRPHEEQL
jgi:hypothetical protein